MSRIDVMSQAVLLVVAQTMVLLALSPFIVGLIRKVKARLQCRRGASVFQPYADLAKLFKKQPVVSTTTSRSEEHTSELQSLAYLVCRLLLEKKKTKKNTEKYI